MRLKDRRMLHQYMDYKRMKIRDLATAAHVSRATVGHLHSGARASCSPRTARAIEEALGAPPGLLFVATSSKSHAGGCGVSERRVLHTRHCARLGER